MFEKNDIISLADDNEYVVVDKYINNDIAYVYLVDINNNNNRNIIYRKLENDEIVELTDHDELEKAIKQVNQNLHNNKK